MRLLRLTPAALDWLRRPGPARVLNVFDRACNLVDGQGEVLALVTAPIGLAPFSALVETSQAAPFRGLAADSAVSRAPGRLGVGDLALAWANAAPWDPRPDWPAVRLALAARPALLEHLAATAPSAAPPGSLLELFRPPFQPGQSADLQNTGAGLEAALWAQARGGASAFSRGLAAPDLDVSLEGVRALAGLGGGLTPAGDDFIVGACLAAWAGLYGNSALALCEAAAAAAASRTTILSGAYLRAAARGECSAYWHDLFAAVCAGGPASQIDAAVRTLTSVGHTSGADALAGFLAACVPIYPA
jgi:hypothetical protein